MSALAPDDDGNGLTPATAKKTIAAGIKAAVDAGVSLVKVCKGDYLQTETLEVPAGIALEGGYDCDNFAAPAAAIDKNAACNAAIQGGLTTIKGSSKAFADGVPVVLFKGNDTPGATMTSIQVVGAQIAVKISDGASPTLKSCSVRIEVDSQELETIALLSQSSNATIKSSCIAGGGGTARSASDSQPLGVALAVGSAGMLLFEDVGTTLQSNTILGGSGKADAKAIAHGSIGLYLFNSSPLAVQENSIKGGTGQSSGQNHSGSVGLFAFSSAQASLSPSIVGNSIDGGSGKFVVDDALKTSGYGSFGVSLSAVSGSSFSPIFRNNTIKGGTGTSPNSSLSSAGVIGFQVGGKLESNNIIGGEYSSPSVSMAKAVGVHYNLSSQVSLLRNSILGANGNYLRGQGVSLSGGPGHKIENNMIHAGNPKAGNVQGSSGIIFSATSKLKIFHNTIAVGNNPNAFAIHQQLDEGGTPILPTETSIDSNILLGGSSPSRAAFFFESCPTEVASTLARNGLVNFFGVAMSSPGTTSSLCASAGIDSAMPLSLSQLVELLTEQCSPIDLSCPAPFAGNESIMGGCVPLNNGPCANLPGCSDLVSCSEKLFSTSWSADGLGIQSLVGGGWLLRPDTKCGAHRVGNQKYTVDDRFKNGVRSGSFTSRGAHEQKDCDNL